MSPNNMVAPPGFSLVRPISNPGLRLSQQHTTREGGVLPLDYGAYVNNMEPPPGLAPLM